MKYASLANTLKAQFLANYSMTLENAKQYIDRAISLNCVPPTVEELLTPKLDDNQRAIVMLVEEMDTADAKRKTQIKYQLKHYYYFDWSTKTYNPPM